MKHDPDIDLLMKEIFRLKEEILNLKKENMKPTIGRIVHYAPPQDCTGATTLDFYAALITRVNEKDVDLVTFGPQSVYFQTNVSFSEEAKPGHWSWPPRV